MFAKLAYRNVKRSARDYVIYIFTMMLVTAVMFAFHSLLFSEDVQKMFESVTLIQVMIGLGTFFVVYAEKKKQRIWHLSVDRYDKTPDFQAVSAGKPAAWSRRFLRRACAWNADGADADGSFLYNGTAGIPYSSGVEPGMPAADSQLLRRMLFAGAAALQA